MHTQTTVTLRGCNGYCVEVESEAVCARWTIAGEWQSFTIEACEEGPERLLRHGDVICLRAHTGKLVRCPNRAAGGREKYMYFATHEHWAKSRMRTAATYCS